MAGKWIQQIFLLRDVQENKGHKRVAYDVHSATDADLTVSHYAHIEAVDYACNWDDQVRKTTLYPYTNCFVPKGATPKLRIPAQKVMFVFGA